VTSESGSCLLFDGRTASAMDRGNLLRPCHSHRRPARRGAGDGARIEPLGLRLGAEKMREAGLIGHRDVQRLAHRAPWQASRPLRAPTPSAWPCRGRGCWIWHHHGRRRQGFQGLINHQPEIPAGWAFNAREACHQHGGRRIRYADAARRLQGQRPRVPGGDSLRRALGAAPCPTSGRHPLPGKLVRTSQMFLAIDVARLYALEEFTARMESLVALVKSAPPAPGYERSAGGRRPGMAHPAERLRNGIPFQKAIGKPWLDRRSGEVRGRSRRSEAIPGSVAP